MSLCNFLSGAAKYVVASLDGNICFPLTGKYALTMSQKAYDRELINRLNAIIYDNAKKMPKVSNRTFIYDGKLEAVAELAERFFMGLNREERNVCHAYLSAIDGGRAIRDFYARISSFAEEFLAKADRDEKDFNESNGEEAPKTLTDNNPSQSVDGSVRIAVDPVVRINRDAKFQRQHMIDLMLGECCSIAVRDTAVMGMLYPSSKKEN